MTRVFGATGLGAARRQRVRWARAACVVALSGAFVLQSGCATNREELEEAREARLQKARAVRDVGVDHLSAGRTAMAIRKLQEAEQIDPTDPVVFLSLGEAYRRKGMLDLAEQHLLRSIELNPSPTDRNRQETILNLSALYIQMKRYADAISRCNELIDDPTFSSPWRPLTNRGWAQLKLGDIPGARVSLNDALDFFPTYWPALLNLGILEHEAGNPLAALRRFEQALDGGRLHFDAVAEANYRMAEIYVALGRRDKAIEHFEVALNESPYGQWGAQSKSYLELLR